jgi:hypothetical protein
MKLADAAEYYQFSGLSKSPATQRWITARLSYFVEWCASQGVAELSDLQPMHVQKYLDGLARGEYAVSGKALSSYTVNGQWIPMGCNTCDAYTKYTMVNHSADYTPSEPPQATYGNFTITWTGSE